MVVTKKSSDARNGKSERRPVEDPLVGTTVGDEFLIERQLGSGGMGAVYGARQRVTERAVAIKILHRHLIDRTVVDRFEQEAQIASKLNHPNIVTVYKYGERDDGGLYIAMEFAEGKSLSDLIASGALKDVKRAVPLMVQMADALAYAHEQKIVHRDIKPSNIMVGKTGRKESVKILDFGIAKVMDDNHIVTKTGLLCGSPEYMSPEQWRQYRDIDGRSDMYSVGCVFYAMLTGRPPFESKSVPGYMMKHVGTEAARLDRRVPALGRYPALATIIDRCMAKDRDDRYADAYELADALRELEDHVLRTKEDSLPSAAELSSASLAAIGGGPTEVSLRSPETRHDDEPESLAFLDDLNFGGDGHPDQIPPAFEQLKKKHSRSALAAPDGFEIDVAHTGPQGPLHRALLFVGAVQLLFLAASIVFLSLNPPQEADVDAVQSVVESEEARDERIDHD